MIIDNHPFICREAWATAMNSSAVKGFVNKIRCRGRMEETEDSTCQCGNWKLSLGVESSSKEKDMNGRSCYENKTTEGLEDGMRDG